MILVDTSIWVEHLRSGNRTLADLLEQEQVLGHPFVIGELALGSLRQREAVLANLGALPQALVATDSEVMTLIDREKLFACGIGYVDAHLLASALITPDTLIWTRDKRLLTVADQLSVAVEFGR